MHIDRQALAELARRLKTTSTTALLTRAQLAAIDAAGDPTTEAALAGSVAAVTSINEEIEIMRRILNMMWLRSEARHTKVA